MKAYSDGGVKLDNNCIPKDEYGLKGIITQNCKACVCKACVCKGLGDQCALTEVLYGLNYYETYVKGCKSKAFQPGSKCTGPHGNLVTIDKGGRVTDINIAGQKGLISTEIGQLTDLSFLQLFTNLLTGGIPTELGQLKGLNALVLLDNQLTGNIPTEIGQLKHLTDLRLHENHLSGNIPTELGQLKGLNELELDTNQLTGGIPTELGKLTRI